MRSPPGIHTQSTTLKPMGLRRLGTRRLSRAHVTLRERPQAVRFARQAMRGVCDVLGRELGCPVQVEARVLEAVVMPATGLAHTAAFALVDLSATGGTAVLELESPVLFAVLDRLSGGVTKRTPLMGLTRLEEASFAFVGLSVLSALRGQGELQGRFSPRLTGVTVNRAEALARLDARQRHLGVELTVTVGQTTAGGRLVVPARSLESALNDLPVERDDSIAPEVLAARLAVHFRVGCSTLSREALATLGVGDVILFAGLCWSGTSLRGPGRLLLRGLECGGEFAPEGFTLNRVLGRGLLQESDMVTAVHERSEGLPPLPVDVEIELTRMTMSLSELAALKPGALLPLRVSASEPVLLRVGDRAVARAELVDIEGEVGARILCLLP
ncbi:type III secretion system apparatus protein YscQ/HrcQ [Cystobacter fuscus]|uniref:Flagellar motor switch protein FliM n=1 Tax=Cystobacter fuscus TaxID=43 RepID=A0A250JFL2_9BACT|nr:type III secretion system cytoplasmic ring protein SctQ [Cystobacter fuscus]ATB42390.1 type III secretion system apparatus protein YscQ/HrcQ [Cystobacter fuscus]